MKSPIVIVLVAVIAFASGAVFAAAPHRGDYSYDDLVLGGVPEPPCQDQYCDTKPFTPQYTLPSSDHQLPPTDKCYLKGPPNPKTLARNTGVGPINIAGGVVGLGGTTGGKIAGRKISLVPAPPGTPIVSVLVERCTTYPSGDRLTWQIVKIPTNYQITVHTERTAAPTTPAMVKPTPAQ